LCEKWHQKLGYEVEVPNYKHLPMPKRMPAAQGFGRRGFAQAGKITNKFQGSKFQTKGKSFGHLKLKFGIYLGFEIWYLEFQP